MKNEAKQRPRIYHGPVNICGIGGFLSAWQRMHKTTKSDFIVFDDKTNFKNSDQNLHLDSFGTIHKFIKRIKFFLASTKQYDIFHFYFGKTLLPLYLDLPILRLLGKKIIMHYVGSDIRLYKLSTNLNPYYRFRKAKNKWDHFDIAKKARMRWQSMWFHYCFAEENLYLHALTSIPKRKIIHDLSVSKAICVPTRLEKPPENPIPVVIHAPTDKNTKGTDFVIKAVKELHDEGLEFKFNIAQNLSHTTLMKELNQSDILVDQLLSGGFGVLAVEGMAFGKPVCGYITPSIRKLMPDLPIVQCSVDNIKEQLKTLILDREKRERIGQKSWKFTRENFDRDKIYEELWKIYLSL